MERHAPFTINPPAFFCSVGIIAVFLAIGVFFPKAETVFTALQTGILTNFGWLYLLSVGIFLFGVLALALGRAGDLKLGPDDSEPDFPFASWLVSQTAPDSIRHEARTAYSDRSRGYDVMNLSKEQLITDILVQFERYLTLVHTPDAALVTTAPAH